jgi:Carboxypeptidase regulatory-like domain
MAPRGTPNTGSGRANSSLRSGGSLVRCNSVSPNNALQRTRVRPGGGRSPLRFKTFGDLIYGLALLLSVPSVATAAVPGSLSGRVMDLNGTALPGVTVTVADSKSGIGTKVVTSDSSGVYVLEGLGPGSYKVSFELSGFDTRAAVVTVSKDAAQNLQMVLPWSPRPNDGTICLCEPLIEVRPQGGRPPTPRLAEQRVRVLDPTGRPLQGVVVEISDVGLVSTGPDGVACWWFAAGYFPWIRINAPAFRPVSADMCCLKGDGEIRMAAE